MSEPYETAEKEAEDYLEQYGLMDLPLPEYCAIRAAFIAGFMKAKEE